MDKREYARQRFKNNLSYEDIGINEIYKLVKILNKKITEAKSCMLMIKEPTNLLFDINKKLQFAELRAKGTYFDDREAITFNWDGWIGFCGWADYYNTIPFVDGFIEWCDYLIRKKEQKHE